MSLRGENEWQKVESCEEKKNGTIRYFRTRNGWKDQEQGTATRKGLRAKVEMSTIIQEG